MVFWDNAAIIYWRGRSSHGRKAKEMVDPRASLFLRECCGILYYHPLECNYMEDVLTMGSYNLSTNRCERTLELPFLSFGSGYSRWSNRRGNETSKYPASDLTANCLSSAYPSPYFHRYTGL